MQLQQRHCPIAPSLPNIQYYSCHPPPHKNGVHLEFPSVHGVPLGDKFDDNNLRAATALFSKHIKSKWTAAAAASAALFANSPPANQNQQIEDGQWKEKQQQHLLFFSLSLVVLTNRSRQIAYWGWHRHLPGQAGWIRMTSMIFGYNSTQPQLSSNEQEIVPSCIFNGGLIWILGHMPT